MKKRYLPIVCGQNTCFSFEENEMCRMVRTSHFGTRWHCAIYNIGDEVLKEGSVGDKKDVLLRDKKCIAELG